MTAVSPAVDGADPDTSSAPSSMSWGSLALVLAAGLYVWVSVWLVLVALVPTLLLGWEPTVITSGSMAPVIRTGDIVLLKDVDAATLAPGTVVAFDDPARPGTRVLHRIVGVHPDGSYRTKGDANAVADSTPVPAERIEGAGALLVPFLGLPLRWLQTAPALALLWFAGTGVAVMLATEPGSAASPAFPRRAGHHVDGGLTRPPRLRTSLPRRQRVPLVRSVRPPGHDDRRTERPRRRQRRREIDDPRSDR